MGFVIFFSASNLLRFLPKMKMKRQTEKQATFLFMTMTSIGEAHIQVVRGNVIKLSTRSLLRFS